MVEECRDAVIGELRGLTKLCKDSNFAITKINELHLKLSRESEKNKTREVERVSQRLWSFYEDGARTAFEEEK